MLKFKFIDDITSDVRYNAYGRDIKEVFENSALALFNVIALVEDLKPLKKIEFRIDGEDNRDLLYNFLQYLIALVDIEGMFFVKVDILEIRDDFLVANVFGENIKPEFGRTVVKAVTGHNFDLIKKKDKWVASVVLDV
ncbi:MAG TPA: archease [Candidatus Nanoarchaeia archaeon]|nr:archease [Candidatus Nanoarchaeia archaeon]